MTEPRPRRIASLSILAAFLAFAAPAEAAVTVTVDPASVTVPTGGERTLRASVNGVSNRSVTWAVNGVPGGNATVGTIGSTGVYTAPAVPPTGWTVTVKATSVAVPSASGTATVTVRHPIPYTTSLAPASIQTGAFTLVVTGSRFVSGAVVRWNGAPLPTAWSSSTRLTATGTATVAGDVAITVANPGPGSVSSPALVLHVTGATPSPTTTPTPTLTATPTRTPTPTVTPTPSATPTASPTPTATPSPTSTPTPAPANAGAARFLEQTTFGPTAALLSRVTQVGYAGFLDEQLAAPPSPWPQLGANQHNELIDAFWANAATGQDQLRQRVIFALSEILVVAFNKNTNSNEVGPWLELLSRNAFGSYRTLLRELTLDATMGKYLDLANSGVFGGAPNENYPREVMQLFSIGLVELNPDGTPRLDPNGQPIPTYTQSDVAGLAKALTGWTYGNASGVPPVSGNSNYYPGPMLPIASRHVATAKTFLGRTLPAGRTAQQDLDDAIDTLFLHPNVGPFLATRLIRALVTSNPNPAYVARVSARFADDGQGVRGNLAAVLRAILLDPEARNDAPPPSFGRLRTHMQQTIHFCRALGLDLGPASQIAYLFTNMNESLLNAPSVFGHYSPGYRIPRTALFGPEFQIYSVSDAVNRANFLWWVMSNRWPINPALVPFVALARNPAALVDAVDAALLSGRMLPTTRAAILGALPAMPDDNARALTALYLAATSGEYQVQR